MNKPFFSNNRSYSRRWNNGQQKPQIRSQKSSNNFTDNFADFSVNKLRSLSDPCKDFIINFHSTDELAQFHDAKLSQWIFLKQKLLEWI